MSQRFRVFGLWAFSDLRFGVECINPKPYNYSGRRRSEKLSPSRQAQDSPSQLLPAPYR